VQLPAIASARTNVVRARLASFVIPFFAVLAVAGTPVLPVAAAAAAVERAPALGGEAERTPVVVSQGAHAQLRVARESNARPSFWKLPPYALTLRLVAAPLPSVVARAAETARVPVSPPSAPRTCRGPPRT
jgi:hypothetical protein